MFQWDLTSSYHQFNILDLVGYSFLVGEVKTNRNIFLNYLFQQNINVKQYKTELSSIHYATVTQLKEQND